MRTNPGRSYDDFTEYSEVEEDLEQQIKFLESKLDKKIKFAISPLNDALPVDSVHKYLQKIKLFKLRTVSVLMML